MRKKKKYAEVLTVGTNSKDQTFFIMGNNGMMPGTHYFTTYENCMIAIFVICKYNKLYTNIYDNESKGIWNKTKAECTYNSWTDTKVKF